VRDFLGRKSLKNTEIYINIERTIFESGNETFTVKVAEKSEDIKQLLETGFEYACQKDASAAALSQKGYQIIQIVAGLRYSLPFGDSFRTAPLF
jgi:hypothetical protein